MGAIPSLDRKRLVITLLNGDSAAASQARHETKPPAHTTGGARRQDSNLVAFTFVVYLATSLQDTRFNQFLV
jgi:hypothetical protein